MIVLFYRKNPKTQWVPVCKFYDPKTRRSAIEQAAREYGASVGSYAAIRTHLAEPVWILRSVLGEFGYPILPSTRAKAFCAGWRKVKQNGRTQWVCVNSRQMSLPMGPEGVKKCQTHRENVLPHFLSASSTDSKHGGKKN